MTQEDTTPTTTTTEETEDMKNTEIITTTFGDSTLLLRADFDPFLNTLKVYFRAGSVYMYVATPRSVFNKLRDADSAGRFFTKNIRNSYESMQLA